MTGSETGASGLEITASRDFVSWLRAQRVSLAFTTYQAGKVFFVGAGEEERFSVFERTFERSMGLCASADAQTIYLSSRHQIWRLENALLPGVRHEGYDRLYIPQTAYTTGDLDVHDLAIGGDGRPLFVNTRYSCLATVSERHSFRPLWRPPFVSKLAGEDRCHLNGVAMEDGRPCFVTCVAESDVADGWRDHRTDGGLVIDVASGETVAGGLSMPHSPRLHRERLWLHNSGSGELGFVDFERGRFEPVAFCPGYLRGLAFAGEYAVAGLSKPRHEERTFSGLELDARLAARKAEPRCGLQIVDLKSGDVVYWVRIEGYVTELYDVAVLPGVERPMAIGLLGDDIERLLTVDPDAPGARG